MHQNRVNKVLQLMAEQNIPQMIVSDPYAVFYLTGTWIHPGERMLVLYLTQSGKHKLFVNELFPLPPRWTPKRSGSTIRRMQSRF